MNIESTFWEPIDGIDTSPGLAKTHREQPAFGGGIGFNEPKKPWKPYIVITIWHKVFQMGWLY